MNSDMQNPKTDASSAQPDEQAPLSRRERRRAERQAASGGAWIVGGVLIAVGILVLLQNVSGFTLNNWWALFILIPAFGAFSAAWKNYKDAGGHLNAGARSSFVGGLILTLVASAFLFNFNWTILGPALIILAGVGLLLNALLPG